MDLLLTSIILGLAGFDVFGFAIVLAAISAKAGKRSILIFAFTVFLSTIVGGVATSLFFAKSVSLIADYFNQLPNSVWLGLDILLIAVLFFWLFRRLRGYKKISKIEDKSSGWIKKGLFWAGLLFAASSIFDPSFIALIAISGHNDNVVLIVLAFTIWILLSQTPLFLLSIAVATNRHLSFINWLEVAKANYGKYFRHSINIALGIAILVLVFDVVYLLTTNSLFFD